MPTPIAPGVIRAQTIFQGASGKPEDRFVTTLHFVTPSGTVEGAQMQRAAVRVKEFWTTPTLAGGNKLTDFLGPQLLRGTGAAQIRLYNLGAPEPRVPTVDTFDILGSVPTQGLPAEVAICLSFSGPQPQLPRTRGRIYYGPLVISAAALEASSKRVVVLAGVRSTLMQAGQRLSVASGDSDLAKWCVYSPTNNATTLVKRGYVDDAFDTQRRRGMAPQLRDTWVTP
jgi:hypothetical protein